MNTKKIVLVNLWGLGDLIATLYFIKKNEMYNYYIITTQSQKTVDKLILSIGLDSRVSVSFFNQKFLLIFDIIKNIFSRKLIIFTAPLSGKSRLLSKSLSYFFKNLILAEEKGNFYSINEKIKIENI